MEEQNITSSALMVYPVPASDFITIRSDGDFSTYTITDITGKIVQRDFIFDSTPEQTISVSELSPGIYFLNLENQGGEVATSKIVISE
jgi:hypothetical protein